MKQEDVVNYIKENSDELSEIIVKSLEDFVESNCNYSSINDLNSTDQDLLSLYLLALKDTRW
jgi:hypothetical protein